MNHYLAINTLAFHGYKLEEAFDQIAQLGVDYVEPVFISKYDQALTEAYFTGKNANRLIQLLGTNQLKVRVVASHMDLGHKDSVEVFRKRMEFSHLLGAKIILSNSSHKSSGRQFFKNMEQLAALAENLEIVIALENPGDGKDSLIGTGKEGISIIKKINSDFVKLNYDFSNLFTLTKGKIKREDALEEYYPYIAHLHLKNVKAKNGLWEISNLKEGIINYEELFERFPFLLDLPKSIEQPVRFGYDSKFNFSLIRRDLPSLKTIRGELNDSLNYLKEINIIF